MIRSIFYSILILIILKSISCCGQVVHLSDREIKFEDKFAIVYSIYLRPNGEFMVGFTNKYQNCLFEVIDTNSYFTSPQIIDNNKNGCKVKCDTSGQLEYVYFSDNNKHMFSFRYNLRTNRFFAINFWDCNGLSVPNEQLAEKYFKLGDSDAIASISFNEGCLDGIQYEFHDNGTLALIHWWNQGLKCGIWKYYDYEGLLLKQQKWNNNELEDEEYFNNGVLLWR